MQEPQTKRSSGLTTTGFKMGGLSRRGVSRLADQGDITRVHVGQRALIVAESVREYVARQVTNG